MGAFRRTGGVHAQADWESRSKSPTRLVGHRREAARRSASLYCWCRNAISTEQADEMTIEIEGQLALDSAAALAHKIGGVLLVEKRDLSASTFNWQLGPGPLPRKD